MIEIQGLTKKYGNLKAIDDISFIIEKGEILGFLGPNGAGKSTTMNIITGYIPANSGSVKICGLDISENPIEVKKKIGYLPETPPLYLDMRVREYLDFVCEIKQVPKVQKEQEIAEILMKVKLEDVKDRLIKNLSKGYKQRVGLAQALIGKPEVLVLDEPTVGLDPKQIIEIRELIKELGKDHTIILSSHILPEVSAICGRVVIINKGKIVAIDKPENLTLLHGKSSRYHISVEGESDKIENIIKGISDVIKVESIGENPEIPKFLVEAQEGKDVRRELFFALAKENLPMLELKPLDATLEEVFLQLTNNETAISELNSTMEVKEED